MKIDNNQNSMPPPQQASPLAQSINPPLINVTPESNTPYLNSNNSNYINPTIHSENILVKSVLYFIFGLLFSFVGLVIWGFWILLKVKEHKLTKGIALTTGFLLTFLFGLIIQPIIAASAQKALISQYPEISSVKQAISNNYPNADVSVTVKFGKNLAPFHYATASSMLSTTLITDKPLSTIDLKKVNSITCSTLDSINKHYDMVQSGIQQKSFLSTIGIPFISSSASNGTGGFCWEYK